MKRSIEKIVEEELGLTKNRIWSRVERIIEHENQNVSRSSMTLQLKNKICQVILTGEEIKGEGDTCIEMNLVDDSTGNIVDVGPEASASVEIVLLKGEPDDDWSVEGFDENIIVREVEGKKPLLAGNVRLKLQGGVGVVENVKLRHHASKIKPSVFRLGARAVETFDGVRIKEAKTERFTVKDFRNKYYKKHETPSLSDEVPRLVNIRKGGKIDKRLQDSKIYTVEDFLIRLLIDPEGLKSIVKMGAKKWDVTVNNARACRSDKRMYCYIYFEQKIGVVFNLLGQVLGLYSKSQYAPISSMLSQNHKADAQELLASAYEHWEKVVPFDDINSLQQYISGLSTYIDPPNSVEPVYHGHENTETIGESSSRLSSFSFQSSSSRMDSIREICIEDSDYFRTDDVDITNYEFSPPYTFDPKSMFADIEDVLQEHEYVDRQMNGPVNNSNADEQIDAAGVTCVESQVVHVISTRPKRWKTLFCVSRLLSIKKRLYVEGINNRKKQKVG